MRWRNGLMGLGLSGIAKAPVWHGVEPRDLETGPSLRLPPQSFTPSDRPSPPLPRERFRCVPGIRRFLLHVLPDGFHRIRHYGFLAKGDRGETLARVRDLLHVEPPSEPDGAARDLQADEDARGPFTVCPDCGGLMRRIGHVARPPATAFRCDTS